MSMEIQAALDAGDETDSFLQMTDVVFDREAEFGFDALKEIEQTIFCIDGLLREVENGGFVQFFYRESGAYAIDTLAALERIKAKESAHILNILIDLFPNRLIPADEEERDALMETIEEEHADVLTQLEDEFHDVGENLVGLTLSYVQRNLKA